MAPPDRFQEKSYRQHAAHFGNHRADGGKAAHARTWLEEDTVDAWRHQRMYRMLDPILMADPKAEWLTVGDGRYGRDAKYILDKGVHALPSDISDSLLEEAKAIGYISDYKTENAESLSFHDSEFDYVLCKESYHHFPRPMLALYEMLRVARKGIILVEPNDANIRSRVSHILFSRLKKVTKWLLGRNMDKHFFEESGNYVFTISRRELEKVALGLNYSVVAFKGVNDAYLSGVEYERFSDHGPLKRKVRSRIRTANFLCKLGLMDYGMLAAIVFKNMPAKELIQQLTKEGYQITHLPGNPTISDS